MKEEIRGLQEKIEVLEGELLTLLHEQETKALSQIKKRRVEFEKVVYQAQRKLKKNLFHWFLEGRLLNYVSAPFIYAMIVPLVFLDVSLFFYQHICFRLYGIARVRRAQYIAFDRRHLGYLNFMEKLNCDYCAYANGLVSYCREIFSRTEQYWCPIKHAHRVADPHKRYRDFLDFGECDAYEKRLEEFRRKITE